MKGIVQVEWVPPKSMWWYLEVGLWKMIGIRWVVNSEGISGLKWKRKQNHSLFPFSFFSRSSPLPQAHKCRPYEHTARKQFSTSQESGPHQTWTMPALDLELIACRTVRGKCLLFKSCVFCYSSPSWIRQAEWQVCDSFGSHSTDRKISSREVKGSFKNMQLF